MPGSLFAANRLISTRQHPFRDAATVAMSDAPPLLLPPMFSVPYGLARRSPARRRFRDNYSGCASSSRRGNIVTAEQ